MMKIGMKAPNFTLPDQENKKIKLSDFKDKYVVIYFYPKDNTSGCTKQAIAFTNLLKEFEKRNAVIIGVSPDTVQSHQNFIEKQNLNLILLSDEEKSVIQKYDVWQEKKMYGRSYMGVERRTFLVDRRGKIIALWRRVKVKNHAEKVLEELDNQTS